MSPSTEETEAQGTQVIFPRLAWLVRDMTRIQDNLLMKSILLFTTLVASLKVGSGGERGWESS